MSEFASTRVMRFTPQGIAAVRLAIEGLRDQASTKKGSQGTPVMAEDLDTLAQLALREDLTEPYGENLEIDTTKRFSDRFEMGRYLAGLVTDARAERDTGLWTWLSMIYLSQLLARRKFDPVKRIRRHLHLFGPMESPQHRRGAHHRMARTTVVIVRIGRGIRPFKRLT